MRCPQCGAETPDTEWNCVACRMNVYWATQHYGELAHIRERQGLAPIPRTPPFLVDVQKRVADERANRGGRVEHKVRQIARQVMRGEVRGQA